MNVLITRPAAQAVQCVNIFSSAGLAPYVLPMIETNPRTPAFNHNDYDICIFTSPTAVAAFDQYAEKVRHAKFIAVGEATAIEVERHFGVNRRDILVPERYYAEEIAPLLAKIPLQGKLVISPGAKSRIKDIGEFFQGSGARFEAPVTYETKAVMYDKGLVKSFLINYNIEVVTFFSPSAAEAFFSQTELPPGIKVVSIGTTTEKSLEVRGIKADIPEKATAESMAELIAQYNK